MAEKTYQRLPGIGRGLFQYARLWAASDHLLLVVNLLGVTESYRRFFFRDIHAIILCRTAAGTVWSIVLGSLVAGLVAASVFAGDAAVVFWIPAAVLFVAFLVNLLRGPTCRCVVRTPVQTVELTPLHRLRSARKTIARLRPRIEAAQGMGAAALASAFGSGATAEARQNFTPSATPPPPWAGT